MKAFIVNTSVIFETTSKKELEKLRSMLDEGGLDYTGKSDGNGVISYVHSKELLPKIRAIVEQAGWSTEQLTDKAWEAGLRQQKEWDARHTYRP